MSSTLYFEIIKSFKIPIKSIIAKKYYNHDGSLSGHLITLTPEKDLDWFEGLIATGPSKDEKENQRLNEVVQCLRDGHNIEMWIEP